MVDYVGAVMYGGDMTKRPGVNADADADARELNPQTTKSVIAPEVQAVLDERFGTDAIVEFRGEHRWLSNFWTPEFPHSLSAEVMYQSMRASHLVDAQRILDMTPGQAKRVIHEIETAPDWENLRTFAMYYAVNTKFLLHPSLADMLLATGDVSLVEGNTWGDTYWGVDLSTGVGENRLGDLLMKIRGELAEDRSEV